MKNVLIALTLSLFVMGCAGAQSPLMAEGMAYKAYLEGEISSGRMPLAQGQYLWEAKKNELRSRQAADSAAYLGIGMAGVNMMNSAGPRPLGNSFNCSSIQQGAFYNTRCQ